MGDGTAGAYHRSLRVQECCCGIHPPSASTCDKQSGDSNQTRCNATNMYRRNNLRRLALTRISVLSNIAPVFPRGSLGMLRTSRCFVRNFLKLGGPDANFTVLLYPCSFLSFGHFFSRNILFLKIIFKNFCTFKFKSEPLLAAQILGGNLAAQFAVIIS